MADRKAQYATQLKNILESSGKTVPQFVSAVKRAGLEKHGQIVAYFKSDLGLTHGNANLMAHIVRDELAGGAASTDDLLGAQYAGGKAHLRPIYETIAKIAVSQGKDVETVVQKTGVTFRRKRNFLVVKAASAKRIELGLNLDETPPGERCVPAKGMCTHKASIHTAKEVDREVRAWILAAYQRAG